MGALCVCVCVCVSVCGIGMLFSVCVCECCIPHLLLCTVKISVSSPWLHWMLYVCVCVCVWNWNAAMKPVDLLNVKKSVFFVVLWSLVFVILYKEIK